MCKEAKSVEMESGGVEQVDVMLCYHYLEAALLCCVCSGHCMWWFGYLGLAGLAGWSGWLVWISG